MTPIRIKISPLSWSDYSACRSMFEDLFDLDTLRYFWTDWKARSEKYSYIARYMDAVVGFALVDTQNNIQYICVHQDFQRQGIGTLLLEKVLDSMSDERSIYLLTASDTRLAAWYGKYGFKVTKNYYDKGYAGSDMVLRQRCRSSILTCLPSSQNQEQA